MTYKLGAERKKNNVKLSKIRQEIQYIDMTLNRTEGNKNKCLP